MPIELQTNISLETQPTDPRHLVNIQWVEEFVAGKLKAPVRVVSTSDQDGTYDPDPNELTLTYTAMGPTVIDGVTLAVDDRVLLTGQTDDTQNGIYRLHVLGDPTTEAVLARTADFNHSDKITTGVTIAVNEGNDHANTTWKLTTTGTIVLDTTALEFIPVTPTTGAKTFAETITGDDIATDFTITHSLGTSDVQVTIWNNATHGLVLTDVTIQDANNVIVGFADPPTPAQVYRVVVIG
ncbi:MAG: hypothetical protein C5B60_00065 [Chloroflexi bacterium]|nr:MAG: hypothetical protein C5B60_00065 [Chloroflexota bacterium]